MRSLKFLIISMIQIENLLKEFEMQKYDKGVVNKQGVGYDAFMVKQEINFTILNFLSINLSVKNYPNSYDCYCVVYADKAHSIPIHICLNRKRGLTHNKNAHCKKHNFRNVKEYSRG